MQLRMRSLLDAEGRAVKLKMWCFPWLTWAVIVFISGVLVTMLLRENQRMEVAATAALALAIVAASWMNRRWRHS